MKRGTILLFSLFFIASLSVAQDKTLEGQDNGSRTNMVDQWEPIDYHPGATTAIFTYDMNGDNTVTGIQARGWFFDDVDGIGLTKLLPEDAVWSRPGRSAPFGVR